MLGRKAACNVVLEDLAVSGFHCTISWHDSRLVIEDRSTNGTFVNGEKILKGQRVVLHNGDTLACAKPKVTEEEVSLFRIENSSPCPAGAGLAVAEYVEPTAALGPVSMYDAGSAVYTDAGQMLLKEQEERAKLTASLVVCQKHLAEQRRSGEALTQKVKSLEQQLQEERKHGATLQEQQSTYAGDLERHEQEKRTADEVRARRDELEKANTDLEVELSSKTRRLQEAEKALAISRAAQQAAEADAEQLRTEATETDARATAAAKQIESLRQERDSLAAENQRRQTEQGEQGRELEKVRAAAAQGESHGGALQAQLTAAQQEVGQLRDDRDQLHSQLAQMEVKWRTSAREKDQAQAAHTALEQKTADLGRAAEKGAEAAMILAKVAEDVERARHALADDTRETLGSLPEKPTLALEASKENMSGLGNSQQSWDEQSSSAELSGKRKFDFEGPAAKRQEVLETLSPRAELLPPRMA